ncbi:hypothetical protein H5V45_14135 [Nocardioides sp. KIGAM211]|uniref:DUF559 domain-containing protein n=1 Tax=Nocardioides luti TaxID=2761101 RepID=A0A7X0RJZ3_9ACTN|nr:hypothetical protein [Nocardioides luti]MBB6628459.1 hypothetical protein [Nocardioides luti]
MGLDRVEQRIVEAAAVLPSYGGVTGWAALRWLGGRWFEGTDVAGWRLPVTLATGGLNVRHQPGIRVCKEKLDPRDLIEVDGLRITTAARSVCFEMRYADNLRLAVRAADMACFNDLVSTSELSTYVLAHAAWTGIPRARDALGLMQENSWSPAEVDLRLVWTVDAGLGIPLCNVPIFDRAGRHLGTPDLFDPDAGVAVEYDSSLHLTGFQRARDVRREEVFRSHGLEYLTSVAADRGDVDALVARIHATRARARWLPESQRAWTTQAPPWWVRTETVEQRRRLTSGQRSYLLRHRAG